MRKLILLALLAITLQAQPFYKQADKQGHFAISGAISALSATYFIDQGYSKQESFIYSLLTSLAVGVAKEAYDEYSYGGADEEDIYADVLGATLGSAIFVQFEWKF